MKRAISFIVTAALVIASFIPAYATNISINGHNVQFTEASGSPFVDQANRTQVPFRQAMEAFGCSVRWDSETRSAIAEKDGITVKVPIGADHIIKNGQTIPNDTAALIRDNKTYLPIRAVLEAFGANVNWDKVTQTVVVTSGITGLSAYTIETIKYEDGSVYVGETIDGVPNNMGSMNFGNNDSYVGHWTNGDCDGSGVYRWSNGDKYDGLWLSGQRTGYGTYTWADGSTWTGEWKNGEPVIEIEPPASVIAKATSTSVINIGWSKVSDADYYYVYYGDSPSGPWYSFSDDSGNKIPQYWIDTYSNSLYGMNPSTTQYFKVTSVKDGVESKSSRVVYATTLASNVAPAATTTTGTGDITGPLSLYSDDGDYEYLGALTSNKYDSDSIFNEYGTYGSKYSSNSIWNEYGAYGGKYGTYSAFNSYSLSPPIIVDGNGDVVGRLTVNKYVTGAISPYEIKQLLIDLGL